jgi:hypothetical protein
MPIIGAGDRLRSQDDVSQQEETVTLSILYLNRLVEVSIVWDESSVSRVNATVTDIPSPLRITLQILSHCQYFRDLKLMFVGSCCSEQVSLRSQQRIVSTV